VGQDGSVRPAIEPDAQAAAGLADQDLGFAEVVKGASSLEMTGDFSAQGSPTRTIEIYSAGVLVTSVAGRTTGPDATVSTSAWPTGVGKLGGGGGTTCFILEWELGQLITIPGEGTFAGDELRILAESPSAAVSNLSEFSIEAADVEFAIIAEELTELSEPVPLFASYGLGIALTALGVLALKRRVRRLKLRA